MATCRRAALILLILCCGCRAASPRHQTAMDAQTDDDRQFLADRTHATADSVRSASDPEIQQVSAEESTLVSDSFVSTNSNLSLSLRDCVGLGLSSNPDLIALRETENVSSAVLGVAQTYPFNPFIQVQATPYQHHTDYGPGVTYHYILLMQTIQLAHQQQFREEGAESMLRSTQWNIHQAELLNVAQTERLYFTAIYQRGLLDLAKASDANNQQLLQTLEKQLDAGQATAADVAIVRIDAMSTQQQVRLAKANYETALRDLKRQLGMAADDPTAVTGDLLEFAWRTSTEIISRMQTQGLEMMTELLADSEKIMVSSRSAARPDVMATQSDVEAARANLSLATASRVPDLQIGPYYQRTADGITFLGFRAHMEIPIMNSGKPLERQRLAELRQRMTQWQQNLRRAELEAQAAWERFKVATNAVNESAADLADVPSELQSLEQQFLEGEVDIVRVIQARTSIIQNQRVRLDLMNEVAQAAAGLTAAAALSIDELLK